MEAKTTRLSRIHKDKRGEIWVLLINGKEYTLLLTNPKYARGGCVHHYSDEHCVVLEGVIEHHVKGRRVKRYSRGDSLFIPKGKPHCFIAIEPSLVIEWGATPEEKKTKDIEWRRKVERINEARLRHV